MMKTIAVSSLRPGLIFSEPVYIDDVNLLVPARIAVRKKDIQQLISWGIDTVATDGELIPTGLEKTSGIATVVRSGQPLSAAIPKTATNGQTYTAVSGTAAAAKGTPVPAQGAKKTVSILALKEVKENQEDYRIYEDLIDKLNKVFNLCIAQEPVPIQSINTITNSLLQAVREQRGQIIGYVLGGAIEGKELAKSSVNTAILAARIAMALKLPPHKIMSVITGSLLHDAGMLKLPKLLLEKNGALSEKELQLIQSHPLSSYKIIKQLGYPDDVAIIAYQHHERWDGQGYPKKAVAQQIDIRARIVAVADAFEAMVSEKPYRTSMEGSQAVRVLYADNGRRFDPEVLKAFIRTMGIYPIGSFVLLNNNAIGRVLSVDGSVPLRPQLEILIDDRNQVYKPGEGKIVDLIQDKDLFISRALDPKEIAKKI
jgi:HD-GYP domain-containing protein (c-di-GMP phosphodiesterase class II)